MQTPNDKAVAKADERAETAAKRNGELSEEREKAFEACDVIASRASFAVSVNALAASS